MMPVQGALSVYVQITVRAGSAHDPTGQEGLAWLTARMITEAGTGELDAAQVSDLLYSLGSELEWVVDKELVTFRARCLAEDAPALVSLVGELVTAPIWSEDSLARLIDEALTTLEVSLLESDEALGDMVLDVWLNEGHPYGHPTPGRTGVLALLTLEDVRSFYDSHYVRQATFAGLAGATSPQLAVDLEQALSSLATTPFRPVTPKPRPVPHGRSLLVVEKETANTGVHFGHPIPVSRDHPDFPALFVAMTAFGEHRESYGRLYQALRETRGLNYGDYAYLEHYRQAGWSPTQELGTVRDEPQFSVWIRPTTPENAPFALKMALIMTEELAQDGLTSQEFEDFGSRVRQGTPLKARTPGRRLGFALDALALDHPDPLQTLSQAVAMLTRADVNAAATHHLHPKDLRIVVVTGDGQAFVDALTGTEPTLPHYKGVKTDEAVADRDQQIAGADLGLDAIRIVSADQIFR
jgi:zinc protease